MCSDHNSKASLHFFRVAVSLINASHTAESPAAVVQSQFNNVRSYTHSLKAARKAAPQIVKSPRSYFRCDLFPNMKGEPPLSR